MEQAAKTETLLARRLRARGPTDSIQPRDVEYQEYCSRNRGPRQVGTDSRVQGREHDPRDNTNGSDQGANHDRANVSAVIASRARDPTSI